MLAICTFMVCCKDLKFLLKKQRPGKLRSLSNIILEIHVKYTIPFDYIPAFVTADGSATGSSTLPTFVRTNPPA